MHHHITINGEPLCDRLNSIAGSEIRQKAGGITCGHETGADAKRAVKALRPFFVPHVEIRAVRGSCPSLKRALEG